MLSNWSERVTYWFRDKDEITPGVYTLLHLDSENKQKTIIGGALSLFVEIFVVYVGISKGIHMVTITDPLITSIEVAYDGGRKQVPYNTLQSKHLFKVIGDD